MGRTSPHSFAKWVPALSTEPLVEIDSLGELRKIDQGVSVALSGEDGGIAMEFVAVDRIPLVPVGQDTQPRKK